ncbi:MAG: DUF2007 domain-containing protein [Verrucomicrobiota bacterium]
MVTVKKCFDIQEALRHKMSLDAAGIPSFIPDEHSATTIPYSFFDNHGVRLQVAEENFETAREVLKDFELPPEEETV